MPAIATIVNVDDNGPARYAKSRTLSASGFQVYNAATAAEAFVTIQSYNPDLVLLDVNLPDLNGIEVCRRLKSSSSGSAVLVLQISASATSAPQATNALNNGADGYLIEPVDPEVLVATVRALLRLRNAERDLALVNERLRTANKDLQRSNEDLKQFAFVASHDLQEPLRTVTSYLQLLKKTVAAKLDEAELSYFGYVLGAASRMRMLIDDLLKYSQVSQVPMNSRIVDLAGVASWATENLKDAIAESGARLHLDPLPKVRGDFMQLGLVFQNLIGNAIKYGKPGQGVEIRLSAQQVSSEEWLISCRDDGIGIHPRYFETIFVPFKRLHGHEIPGSGIGLAVCRRIIEAHGGTIRVESTVDQGSTFLFTLPSSGGTTDDARGSG